MKSWAEPFLVLRAALYHDTLSQKVKTRSYSGLLCQWKQGKYVFFICALVSAGLGVAILPRSIFQTSATPIAIVNLSQPRLTRTVTVAWRSNVYHSAAATAFVAFARDAADA